MKKINFKFIIPLIIITILIASCSQNISNQDSISSVNSETNVNNSDKIKLVWVWSDSIPKSNIDYFNRLLSEKGYDFEVDFITINPFNAEDGDYMEYYYDERNALIESGAQVDIMLSGDSYSDSHSLYDYKDDRLLCLDDLMATDTGQALYNSIPENIWPAYMYNGSYYTLPTNEFCPTMWVCFWNQELADKYDLDIESWDWRLWNYTDEILRVYEGEKDNKDFTCFEGLNCFITNGLPGYDYVNGTGLPLVVDVSENETDVQFLFELEDYKKMMAFIEKMEEMGVYSRSEEWQYFIEPDTNKEYLFRFTSTYSLEEEDTYYSENGKYNCLELEERRIQTHYLSYRTGINKNSNYTQEAFELLSALYQDAELTNALVWGEEGDYEIINGQVQTYYRSFLIGNSLISYGTLDQVENKEQVYWDIYSNTKLSSTAGFYFDNSKCSDEYKAVSDLFLGYRSYSFDELAVSEKDMEDYINMLEMAGLNKVKEEIEKQYAEFVLK